ncbi:Methyltransferase-like protein 13 [Holothuria leucospilota]|uniref:Methyltransferase-like protein 13 n=1 Tax=Holothuria leucospilota TaxID=206669 RepID=A0A9Q1C701_HOLLE|nr:Methyltransferase-like protein 13 [Holothuria leucospilota]
MDLLPKTQREFSSAEYWNSFFKKRGKESFEWYGEYTELCGILHKYIKTKDNTLVIGCGSSRLSEDMYDLGYHSMVNIDISEVVIKQMKTRNATKRPSMVFEKMDVFKVRSYSIGIE